MSMATPAGRGGNGSAPLDHELDGMRRERDPRSDDEAFYTGLGYLLLRSLDRELRELRGERRWYDYINGRNEE